MSSVPGQTRFNLNFSNPGGSAPFESLLLSPRQMCSSDDMAPIADSDGGGSSASTPLALGDDGGDMDADGDGDADGQPATGLRLLPNGKKTKGRVKIRMEFIQNKLRRYTTFSKRKTGIMKKAHELSTLTGTQVMLLVASETGHVYAFATHKLRELIGGEPGKSLIQSCLNAPDDAANDSTAVRTEFTFDPSGGGGVTGASSARKRKADFEPMTLPTMVPATSSSPAEEETAASDESDGDGVDTTAMPTTTSTRRAPTPSNGSSSRMDAAQLQKTLKEALREAAEQRRRNLAAQPPSLTRQTPRPSAAVVSSHGRQARASHRQQHRPSQPPVANADQPAAAALDWLLPLLLQGAAPSTPTVSSNSSSPPALRPCTLNSRHDDIRPSYHSRPRDATKRRCRDDDQLVQSTDETKTEIEEAKAETPLNTSTGTVLFQLPQGTVYATAARHSPSQSSSSPRPLSANADSSVSSASPRTSDFARTSHSNTGSNALTLQQLLTLSQIHDTLNGKH